MIQTGGNSTDVDNRVPAIDPHESMTVNGPKEKPGEEEGAPDTPPCKTFDDGSPAAPVGSE